MVHSLLGAQAFRFRVSGRYATSEAHAVCALSADTFLLDLGPWSDMGDHHTSADQINVDPINYNPFSILIFRKG